MIATPCASIAVPTSPRSMTSAGSARRTSRKPGRAAEPAKVEAKPVRFTRVELVGLLRDYRDAEQLTPAQRAEAVAWITGHQHARETNFR